MKNKKYAAILSAVCLMAAASTTVLAANPKAAETQPAKAAETQPAKAAEEKLEFKGKVSKKLTTAELGSEQEFDIYLIEPSLFIEANYGINLKPIHRDPTKQKLVCRAALDPDEKEIIWVVIDGSDYCEYISGTKIELLSRTYKHPAKLKGKVIRSAKVADDMEPKISSGKVIEYVSVEEPERVFDEKAAVEFSKNKKNDTEAYVEKIEALTPVSYTYTTISGGLNRTEYKLGYLIFKATVNDGEGTNVYIAFDPEVYVKDIDPSLKYEFDTKSVYVVGSRLKGDFKEKEFEGSGLSLYGYTADAEEVLEGLSKTAGEKILIYDHVKK